MKCEYLEAKQANINKIERKKERFRQKKKEKTWDEVVPCLNEGVAGGGSGKGAHAKTIQSTTGIRSKSVRKEKKGERNSLGQGGARRQEGTRKKDNQKKDMLN